MQQKLPSGYRAERDQIVRDLCVLAGQVSESIGSGKYGYRNSSLLQALNSILHRADADLPFDVEAVLAKARENEKAKENPPRPVLRAIK